MTTDDLPIVRCRDVDVVRAAHHALDHVSLDLPRGGVVGLLGPSGGGKTTLMRCLVGVQRLHGGSVHVLGTPAGSPALRRRVGYTTQAPSVYPDISVRENLHYFARVLSVGRDRIAAVLDQVSLADHADTVVSRLSGGQLVRASLAVALLAPVELLILDEPTVGLDPLLRRDLWRHFRRLADSGVTLIVSSHVMDEARHCNNLILLRDGRVVAHDTPEAIRRRTGAGDIEEAFVSLVSAGAST